MTDLPEYPLVTLALFAYNQEKYIREAVESALQQDYAPLELIISDDCSSDSTFSLIQQVVSEYQGPHTVFINRMPENGGLANHLNYVFEMARGEIIVVAAGDDICFASKVSALVMPMLLNDSVVGVHSGVIEIDTDGGTLLESHLDNPELLKEPCQIVESSLAVVSQSHAFQKRVHDLFGPYDKSVTNEGKVMAFRESMVGNIVYLNVPLTYYRQGSGVSTYQGTDIDALTLVEPKKVASWNYTSIAQIERDFETIGCSDAVLGGLIARRRRYLKKLLAINTGRFKFLDLFSLSLRPHEFLIGAKAFARVNSPRFVRAAYCRWLMGGRLFN